MDIKIEDLLTEQVASPPTIYHQLQSALSNPSTTFEEFEAIIQTDTGLSSRLLKIANSPFYGFDSQVESIAHALSIIGMQQMSDLALVSLVIDKFKGIPRDLIDMEGFWKHSIACGLAARLVASKGKKPNIERYYLAGILHDIGSLLLNMELPVQARLILSQAKLDKTPLYQVEKQELGFAHPEIGAHLLESWRLPTVFIAAVRYHHQPLDAPGYKDVTCAVHFADCLIYELNLGNSGEPTALEAEPEVIEFLELSPADISKIKKETLESFSSAMDAFY